MVQKILNWKESINTVLLAVVSYLIVDMHNTFKEVIKDVEDLKIRVEKHDYILNIKADKKHKDFSFVYPIQEAILPNDKIKVETDNKHTEA